MRKIFYFISIAIIITLVISSCNDTTYATELKNEKELIQDFIDRQGIKVIKEIPADSTTWKENEYYLTADGLYINITNPGTGDKITTYDIVVPRYLQYTLYADADTVKNLTTVDNSRPTTFIYGNDTKASTAFQEAVYYMKRNGSEAKLIIPSKINSNDFWDPATPMGYDFNIKILK